jgi:hypothetical protein
MPQVIYLLDLNALEARKPTLLRVYDFKQCLVLTWLSTSTKELWKVLSVVVPPEGALSLQLRGELGYQSARLRVSRRVRTFVSSYAHRSD